MPEAGDREALERARADERAGKAASTQAGEFIREEIHHVREGKHGARSAKQAIAIGLSKARRAGVKLGLPGKGKVSESVRKQAARDSGRGRGQASKVSAKRSRATLGALKREGHAAASHEALARQARSAAARRNPGRRSAAAIKAVRTKGPAERAAAARKAARTRAREG